MSWVFSPALLYYRLFLFFSASIGESNERLSEAPVIQTQDREKEEADFIRFLFDCLCHCPIESQTTVTLLDSVHSIRLNYEGAKAEEKSWLFSTFKFLLSLYLIYFCSLIWC